MSDYILLRQVFNVLHVQKFWTSCLNLTSCENVYLILKPLSQQINLQIECTSLPDITCSISCDILHQLLFLPKLRGQLRRLTPSCRSRSESGMTDKPAPYLIRGHPASGLDSGSSPGSCPGSGRNDVLGCRVTKILLK